MSVHTVTAEIGGMPVSIETGRMACLAAGAAVMRIGDTIVLAAASHDAPRPGIDFFPLTIDYREKTYAAGKIPGGFFKREGRPTTKEIITMRLTDRSIRPLFPEGYKEDIQVQIFVLSADPVVDPDVLALNAASCAMALSPIPWLGPVGCVRVGLVNDELIVNPTRQQIEESAIDLIVAGTAEAVTMVEGSALEVPEEKMIEAIRVGHAAVRQLVALQNDLVARAGRPKLEVPPPDADEGLRRRLHETFRDAFKERYTIAPKLERSAALSELRKSVRAELIPAEGDEAAIRRTASLLKGYIKDLERDVIREAILGGRRVDGRGEDDIRPITSEVQILPRVHGSALFTRGETQALVTCTLGTSLDEQIVDGLGDEYKSAFMLHYNFPPFCVGEVRPIRGPGRREIGHGNLAERAVQAILPDHDDFPYTIRIVSDVLMSNGSSSMASVCGATLSMMDAGVPIKQPVAGIAMGLVKEGNEVRILSDILGDEDHCGDMDFKVTGTQKGVTALQMDIKATGLEDSVMGEALQRARTGCIHILREMLSALPRPRPEISDLAPRMVRIVISKEKIGSVIGPGGKTIRALQEEFETKIDVEDDGSILIFGHDGAKVKACQAMIEGMTQEAELGKIYEGKVVSIREFGCFVQLAPGLDGLVHVSELSDGYVDRVEDVVNMDDVLRVKCIAIDDQGRVKLSRKAVILEEGGASDGASGTGPTGGGEGGERPERPERSAGDRGPRGGGDRGGRGGPRGGGRGGSGPRGGGGGGRGGPRRGR